MIIGLSGYARTGKDTVADILVKEAGFVRMAFADKLREALYALNPIVFIDRLVEANDEDVNFILDYPKDKPYRLQKVIDYYGWNGVKDSVFGPEVRRLLQRMGTEVGRNVLGENVWVDAAMDLLDVSKNYVFTDCRFTNEARAVNINDGQVWRVTRPGTEPVNDHISEIGLDNWPFSRIILNDGSIEDLRKKVLDGVQNS